MITLDVTRAIKLKGIEKPYSFLTANGFTHHTAYRMTNGKPRSIKFQHLEKLCRILHCEPHELLAYTPDKNSVLPVNDHLAFLAKEEVVPVDLRSIMKTLSPKEVHDLATEIAQRYRKAS